AQHPSEPLFGLHLQRPQRPHRRRRSLPRVRPAHRSDVGQRRHEPQLPVGRWKRLAVARGETVVHHVFTTETQSPQRFLFFVSLWDNPGSWLSDRPGPRRQLARCACKTANASFSLGPPVLATMTSSFLNSASISSRGRKAVRVARMAASTTACLARLKPKKS